MICGIFPCFKKIMSVPRAMVALDEDRIERRTKMKSIVHDAAIERRIKIIRGHKVMLDEDLSFLYEVPTKVLIQSVKRNSQRFPDDFMFQLKKKEFQSLRSQFVTSKRGGRRYLPYVFTEQGVAMLSSVLNSERAIQMNVAIMRTFVKMRQFALSYKELAEKLNELERKTETHDKEIKAIFNAIRRLMTPPVKPKRRIGFRVVR